jgi:membrane protease YdiL (CAAX protease family)
MRLGRSPRLPLWAAWLATLVLAVLLNLVNNRWLPNLYVVTGPAGAALLLLVARSAGLGWDDLGLARRTWRVGLGWAVVVVAVVASGYAAAALLPVTQGLFSDDRVRAESLGALLFAVVIRIPLGTVVLEEVLFRGVLLGLGARTMGWGRSAIVSSTLFGLWHVLPARGAAVSNPAVNAVADAGGGYGVALAVAAAVVGTGLAGLLFCWLRIRSGSLLAPIGLHLATNSVGYLTAYFVLRG